MNKERKLSVQQYADEFGGSIPKSAKSHDSSISRQAILYRINNRLELPFVKECVKVGRAYILTVLT